MKISSIVDIVNGTLQNQPSISFVTQSHTNIKKVNDGDLFISSSFNDINKALTQGAFAIIYDSNEDYSTLDNEIAWIKVDNIKEAIQKLLRYNISQYKIKSYIVDNITYEILKTLIIDKTNFIFLKENIKTNFELLKLIGDKKILIGTNKKMLLALEPLSKKINIKTNILTNLTIHSLFETTFSYKDKYFYKLPISRLYVDNFIRVLNFLKFKNYNITKLAKIDILKPIFINKNFQIVPFGSSNQFILTNQNPLYIKKELQFIKQYYRYGILEIIDAKKQKDLLNSIQTIKYNCLYIKNTNYEKIVKLLQKNETPSLNLF